MSAEIGTEGSFVLNKTAKIKAHPNSIRSALVFQNKKKKEFCALIGVYSCGIFLNLTALGTLQLREAVANSSIIA